MNNLNSFLFLTGFEFRKILRKKINTCSPFVNGSAFRT